MMRKGQKDSYDVTMPEVQTCERSMRIFNVILASQSDSQISDTQTVTITCEAARLPGLSS